MDLHISNFKAISSFNYEKVKNFTILTGINSGGKSSFLHSLLMMKQSTMSNTPENPVILNGELINLGSFKDILHKNKLESKGSDYIEYKLTFTKESDSELMSSIEKMILNQLKNSLKIINFFKSVFSEQKIYDFSLENNKSTEKTQKLLKKSIENKISNLSIKYKFKYKNEKVIVHSLDIRIKMLDSPNEIFLTLNEHRNAKTYNVSTNSSIFYNDFKILQDSDTTNFEVMDQLKISSSQPWLLENVDSCKLNILFSNLRPSSNPLDLPGQSKKSSSYLKFGISNLLDNLLKITCFQFFDSISYIGPLREAPQSLYLKINDYDEEIGSKGENLINILVQNKEALIKVPKLENEKIFIKEMKFLDGLNYWLCEVFEMAEAINIKPYNDGKINQVLIKNRNGVEVPISAVGFGVSQVLPIIAEGLLLKENKVFIVEQPEIHLHPKLQSIIFDFLYALTFLKKKVIVETHSDHLINRMRLRIAEDEIQNESPLNENLGLFFVEDNNIKSINIDLLGVIQEWPKGFFDQSTFDNIALIKAQALKKRRILSDSTESRINHV